MKSDMNLLPLAVHRVSPPKLPKFQMIRLFSVTAYRTNTVIRATSTIDSPLFPVSAKAPRHTRYTPDVLK